MDELIGIAPRSEIIRHVDFQSDLGGRNLNETRCRVDYLPEGDLNEVAGIWVDERTQAGDDVSNPSDSILQIFKRSSERFLLLGGELLDAFLEQERSRVGEVKWVVDLMHQP